MTEKILILDFGSQYTQLIARAVREANVYCEIKPFNTTIEFDSTLKGVILSGSPASVNEADAPNVDIEAILAKLPVLTVCYGAQLSAKNFGGKVEKSNKREYGRAQLRIQKEDIIFKGIANNSQVWMSHSDSITQLPANFELLADTESIPVAAFRKKQDNGNSLHGFQFHPEVYHSTEGKKMIENFLVGICGCQQNWTPSSFVQETVDKLKAQIGDSHVIMALSGGVDSTVAATLIHRAIGDRLHGIFVDNGVLRKNEFQDVLDIYKTLGLNVTGIDAKDMFYDALAGKSEPEEKRKIIGKLFIDVFQVEASKVLEAKFLGQGTIYPDVIESVSVHGPSQTIKSHHNVGGLPDDMALQLVEPLRELFKDEVRKIGLELGLPYDMVYRHPFPGPGLGVRILGEVKKEYADILREADAIFIEELHNSGWYHKTSQAFAVFLPIKSVGVVGDARRYEWVIALRAVETIDFMTARWAHLPYELLEKVSNRIINEISDVSRVAYDVSSKPPATIEWE